MNAPATTRPLRADAERSMRAILEAAERVLSTNPGASMAQIASAAGVARTTIHRRFSQREALLDALAVSAARQLAAAVDDGHPDTAPPLVALHRITANVLEIKTAWSFSLQIPPEPASEAAALHQEIGERCVAVLMRAQAAGLIDQDVDLHWTQRVYYALLGESLQADSAESRDADALAARIIDTLLHGAAPRSSDPLLSRHRTE